MASLTRRRTDGVLTSRRHSRARPRAIDRLLRALVLSSVCSAASPASAEPGHYLNARVVHVRGDRVYVAAADSTVLDHGTLLRFRDRGKELAVGEVTAVQHGTIIAVRITSGSLDRVKRLDRLEITTERPPIPARPTLRVGYPSRSRVNPLFECGEMILNPGAYRADTLAERSFRLVRDSTWVPQNPEPDTLLIRLFDEVADEEIALERGEVDVAVFWPGEASPHIREAMQWKGQPKVVRSRGAVTYKVIRRESNLYLLSLPEADRRVLGSLNQEIFRGDLVGPPLGEFWSAAVPGRLMQFEVDSSCPGHDVLERFLNRDRPISDLRFQIHLACSDMAGPDSPLLFAIGCPVISRPELRPYLNAIDLDALVNRFDCSTPGRKP